MLLLSWIAMPRRSKPRQNWLNKEGTDGAKLANRSDLWVDTAHWLLFVEADTKRINTSKSFSPGNTEPWNDIFYSKAYILNWNNHNDNKVDAVHGSHKFHLPLNVLSNILGKSQRKLELFSNILIQTTYNLEWKLIPLPRVTGN